MLLAADDGPAAPSRREIEARRERVFIAGDIASPFANSLIETVFEKDTRFADMDDLRAFFLAGAGEFSLPHADDEAEPGGGGGGCDIIPARPSRAS